MQHRFARSKENIAATGVKVLTLTMPSSASGLNMRHNVPHFASENQAYTRTQADRQRVMPRVDNMDAGATCKDTENK